MTDVRVLHRDADLLVLFKPTGLPTTSPDGRGCLTEIAQKLDAAAPRLHASSRLDAEVTGVVTFARTTRAIEGLLAARQAGQYERYYLGLAVAAPQPEVGHFAWPIDRDPRDPRKRVALEQNSKHKGKDALTRYRVLHSLPTAALLLLSPLTGRTHQLRVHVARAGVPLLGDRHYGGPMRCTLPTGQVVRAGRVMLHCARVRLPKIGETGQLTVDAPIPDDFRAVWLALGGATEALQSALDSAESQSQS